MDYDQLELDAAYNQYHLRTRTLTNRAALGSKERRAARESGSRYGWLTGRRGLRKLDIYKSHRSRRRYLFSSMEEFG